MLGLGDRIKRLVSLNESGTSATPLLDAILPPTQQQRAETQERPKAKAL